MSIVSTESKVTAQASGSQTKLTHLTDIEPEEVSLVDRAANRRKFLIVKQETGSETQAMFIVQNADGTLSIQKAKDLTDEEKAAKAGKGKEEDAEKAGGLEAWAKGVAKHLTAAAEALKGQAKMTPEAKRYVKAAAEALKEFTDAAPDKAKKAADEGAADVEVELLASGADDVVLRKMARDVLGFPGAKAETVATIAKAAHSVLTCHFEKASSMRKPTAEEEEAEQEKAKKAAKAKEMEDEAEKAKKAGAPNHPKDCECPICTAMKSKSSAKKFTPARAAKLMSALTDLGGVLKEVGVADLDSLLSIAKGEIGAEAEVVTKALGELGVTGATSISKSDSAEVVELRKRLERLESQGISKNAGGDGTGGQQNKPNLWKGTI